MEMIRRFAVFIFVLAMLLFSACAPKTPKEPADILLVNGQTL